MNKAGGCDRSRLRGTVPRTNKELVEVSVRVGAMRWLSIPQQFDEGIKRLDPPNSYWSQKRVRKHINAFETQLERLTRLPLHSLANPVFRDVLASFLKNISPSNTPSSWGV